MYWERNKVKWIEETLKCKNLFSKVNKTNELTVKASYEVTYFSQTFKKRFFDNILEIELFFIQKYEQIIVLFDPQFINDLVFLVDKFTVDKKRKVRFD